MISFRNIIFTAATACLAVSAFTGCEMQRNTIKFGLTPEIEDTTTDPQRLSNELGAEMQLEDEKRRSRLQEDARVKAEAEKAAGKPAVQKSEEAK